MASLLIVIAGSIGLGFFLIFLLAVSDKKRKRLLPPDEKRLSPEQFEKVCLQVMEEMKLDVREIVRPGEHLLDMVVRNPTPITGGDYLVRCLYLDSRKEVTSVEVIEFSSLILQERLSKGIFITTGTFTEERSTIGELAPIEFIDGEAFKKLLAQYAPDYRLLVS